MEKINICEFLNIATLRYNYQSCKMREYFVYEDPSKIILRNVLYNEDSKEISTRYNLDTDGLSIKVTDCQRIKTVSKAIDVCTNCHKELPKAEFKISDFDIGDLIIPSQITCCPECKIFYKRL